MVVIIISLILFQIATLIFAYFFIKERIEKKLINKEVLEKIKREINLMIVRLNETTVTNINLIEEKIKELDKKIVLVDKKKASLKLDEKNLKPEKIQETKKIEPDLFNSYSDFVKEQQITYKPEKIVNQSKKTSENIKDEMFNIDEKLKKLSTREKVAFLIEQGWETKDIQRKLNLTSGEMEFLLNIENINN